MELTKQILLIIFWLPKQIALLIWFVLGAIMAILNESLKYYYKSMNMAEIDKGLKQAEKLKAEINKTK